MVSEQYIRFYQEIASTTKTRKRYTPFKKEKKSEIIMPPTEIIDKQPQHLDSKILR